MTDLPLIALLTALVTATAALGAAWITSRHNRGLKVIELREQTARTIRQEKREVYLELLKANRMLVQYAVQMGYMGLGQQLQVNIGAVAAASDRFQRMIPELELVASRPIYDLSQRLYAATSRCTDAMYRESERRFADLERDNPDQSPSPEQKAAIWEEVRAEVQKVYEEQGIEGLYRQLRNQVREELGFLVLDPTLVPTPEETAKLRRELANLDQIPNKHGPGNNPAGSAEPWGKVTEEGTVRARRFELVDDVGETRALLDTGLASHVGLSFFSKRGQELATVGVMPDGFSSFVLNDENGREAIKAVAGRESSNTVIALKDGDGRTRLQAGISDVGEPALALTDERGNVRAQTYIDAQGSAVMILKDGGREANVTVSAGTENTGLVVADGTDRGRIGMLVQADSGASLAMTDAEGKPKVMFGVQRDGRPIAFVEEQD